PRGFGKACGVMSEVSDKLGGSPPNIDELIRAVALRSDKYAFKVIFGHFAPRLKSFIMGQGTDPQLAEEVVQETLIKVWRKAEQFDPAKASASTWVYTIARNVRIDLLRKSNRPEPDIGDPAMVPDPEPQAHELISRDQEAVRLRRAVAGLPSEQGDVLRLAFFEEIAHPEIAERLNIPLGTVKSRIRLAMKRVRTELGEFQ
ncbi:MAG: sigma-70 family RNA polymerase sigma factor, partial [Paracoccaceae bacterium]|nr:sigma-70 family RNA polymerase sigma factor [Paracoccaceae bacterium]